MTVNSLGQVLTSTDRNGSTHTLGYDVLGRVVSDAVTTLGSGVDGSVRRIETAYDGQGNAYLVTAYDAATSGSIVNQVQRAFDGLGNLTREWQSHSGAANTSTTPSVQYAYSTLDASNKVPFADRPLANVLLTAWPIPLPLAYNVAAVQTVPNSLKN